MEENRIKMYKSKISDMPYGKAVPSVNISNWRVQTRPPAVWGPRTIPDTELILISEGCFTLELEDETVQAKKGDLLIILPNEHHRFQCLESPGEISCIHCDLPQPEGGLLPRVRQITDSELPGCFRRCAQTFLQPSPRREALLQVIMTEIWIRIRPADNPVENPDSSSKAAQMADYIRTHLEKPVTRNELARQFHISPQHINYLFKKELGVTPTELLHNERVKSAFQMILLEHVSIQEAAERTGFYDAYHFSKVFKKAYGFPPGHISRFFKPQEPR
jgi:AraC-like DNA-binding protein/quercetin dioxygenase-like cupin family protein